VQPVPLFGAGVYGKSAVVTRQRRVNCYYEQRQDGDKAKVVIYGTPGLLLDFNVSQPTNLPIRAILGTNETSLYALQYNQFLSLSPTGTAFFAGSINTINGLASLALNPSASQVMLVDGQDGWVYQPGPNTLTKLAATGTWWTPGAKTVTNVGGYFVAEIPGTGEFGVSNVNDATTGSSLSFATAAAYADQCIAVDNLQGNLLTFGNIHTEFWQPVGTPPPSQPFANIQSAANEWGLAAIFSRQHVDQALFFLAKTRQGTRRVVRIDGYVPTPVSTEIDAVINTKGFVYADAVACSYQRDVHSFYQLTFPTMMRTFVYDCSTGIWNEAQSGLSTGPFVRHQANLATYYSGDTLLTDYQNGNIYRMDDNTFTDNGAPVLREVITKHQLKGFNRFKIPDLYLDMETGVGVSSGAVQDMNPQVSIECSKDNGRTWLAPRLISLGPIGNYRVRVRARRFGQARVFTFRIRMTAACKFVITDGATNTKVRAGAAQKSK
jgi:hypothetical protein